MGASLTKRDLRSLPRSKAHDPSERTRLRARWVERVESRIAEEVISHLVGLVGSKVRVSLDIEAEVGDGIPDGVVRTVTENGRTLKFSSQGFERE